MLALWAAIGGVGVVDLGRRPSAADPVARNSQAAAFGPDRRRSTARRSPRAATWAAPQYRCANCPTIVPKAFIAIEDRRFYSHHGVDPLGIMRALAANVLRRGASQGGSTITQQLAKNLFLTQERTVTRKLQEVVLALWLEHKFSKAQILELYLNRVYFGAGAYGVEGAAQRYFGKSARHLTLAEAAMLAGLVQSPSRLAPSHNPDGAERRARVVLADMADQKLTSEDADRSRWRIPRTRSSRRPPARSTTSPTGSWMRSTTSSAVSMRTSSSRPRSIRHCKRRPSGRLPRCWRRREKNSASAKARWSR